MMVLKRKKKIVTSIINNKKYVKIILGEVFFQGKLHVISRLTILILNPRNKEKIKNKTMLWMGNENSYICGP